MSTVQVKYAGPNRRLKNRRSSMHLHKPNRRLNHDRRRHILVKTSPTQNAG